MLVGRLVVVARGLYLARHLFSLLLLLLLATCLADALPVVLHVRVDPVAAVDLCAHLEVLATRLEARAHTALSPHHVLRAEIDASQRIFLNMKITGCPKKNVLLKF